MFGLRRILVWCFSLSLVNLVACSDHQPLTVEGLEMQAAKPAGIGPVKVNATDPPSGEQTQRLFVRVLGSGFDDGSVATWIKEGDPTGVMTHSTQYVSDEELVADIEIDELARLGLWDVEVMTLRGKKGIGIESFEVKEKTPPGQVEFDAYTAVDLGTLGRRKGLSTAGDVGDLMPGGILLVTGRSQEDARRDEMPVLWEVTLTDTDTVVEGPVLLSLPQGEFYSGRSGRISDDVHYIVGWGVKPGTVDGSPIYNAVRWEYAHGSGVTGAVAFGPLEHPEDPDAFLASAGRGVNNNGDVVGNSSADHPVAWDIDGDGVNELEAPKIATLWEGHSGTPTALFSPLHGQSIAYAINNQGYVVGTGMEPAYFNPGGELERHAILWLLDGTPCDLGESGIPSEAYNLTDLDASGGFFVSGTWDSRGTVWRVSPDEAFHTCSIEDRWTLDVTSIVGGIRVVDGGWETTGMGEIIVPGQDHPLSWRLDFAGSTVTPLGEMGRGFGVNGSGVVAGFFPVSDREHAVLWLPK